MNATEGPATSDRLSEPLREDHPHRDTIATMMETVGWMPKSSIRSRLVECARRLQASSCTPAAPERGRGSVVASAAVSVSRELLESLIDGDPCSFDHHGGCQAHGYLELEPGELCPQAELKQHLAVTAP